MFLIPNLLYEMLFVIYNCLLSSASDFLYRETVKLFLHHRKKLLPVSSIFVIFTRSGDQDGVYQTILTNFQSSKHIIFHRVYIVGEEITLIP